MKGGTHIEIDKGGREGCGIDFKARSKELEE
jgi:hypothetical protein